MVENLTGMYGRINDRTFFCEGCGAELPISELKLVHFEGSEHEDRLCTWCAVKPHGIRKPGICKTCGEFKEIVVFEFEPDTLWHNECFDCSCGRIARAFEEDSE